MFKDLARIADRLFFGGHGLGSKYYPSDGPTVGGVFKSVMRERGKIVPGSRREGHNIWTLTGREFIVETISLAALVPARLKNRDDALLYFGLGIGSTPEVAAVSRLVDPVVYIAGEFLAPAQVPVTFPSVSLGTPKTAVQLIREYSDAEISLTGPVVLTEFGCFTDGDPASNNVPPRPTAFDTAKLTAPVGYKTFEPFTKTSGRTLEVIYELRVV